MFFLLRLNKDFFKQIFCFFSLMFKYLIQLDFLGLNIKRPNQELRFHCRLLISLGSVRLENQIKEVCTVEGCDVNLWVPWFSAAESGFLTFSFDLHRMIERQEQTSLLLKPKQERNLTETTFV
ncbi:hypothetical protein AMECASPLE_035687 [Ameca splendens]|uniref:Uncharacterized protein n=1 Tax=Ameca splendens TaxID=208324 RepID=A0ABV0ZG75_9TELE